MLLPDREASAPDEAVHSIFIVVVLYGMSFAESPTCRTLMAALEGAHAVRTEFLLFDNTPQHRGFATLPRSIHYVASAANTGLATAYNMASRMAAERGFTWLLTLDQDTELPATFFSELARILEVHAGDSRVASIVPHIRSGDRTVSPHWFVRDMYPRWFPAGYSGLPQQAVYAFNSGALVRIEALQAIGGYSPLFWLDNCDLYLFRRFETIGMRVFVAGTIQLQHDFSMVDAGRKMSLARYGNAVEAGSAFCDLEYGWVAGLEYTGILVRRYIRQMLERAPRAMRQLTARMIVARLFRSKTRRLRQWTQAQDIRMEGYAMNDPMVITSENHAPSEALESVQGSGGKTG